MEISFDQVKAVVGEMTLELRTSTARNAAVAAELDNMRAALEGETKRLGDLKPPVESDVLDMAIEIAGNLALALRA